jgi:cystathionine beta-synthase
MPDIPRGALDLIGNTPLVEITRLDAGPCRLFAKLESQNPGGSIKDRPALKMVEAAEADGRLKPGGTIVEATAGNTGLGLALIAALKGYRLVLVIPDKMSREKVSALRALGAEVVMTRSDVGKGHPDYYQDKAKAIAAATPGAFFVDQFSNPANPLAHEEGTAPEIWEQAGRDVDAVVVGVGSGGTLTGISRFFARVSPKTEIVLADPDGSILADIVAGRPPREPGSWLVEGIGEDFVPPNADLSRVRRAYTITDAEGVAAAREMLRAEGLLIGSSAGTLLAAALRYAREQTEPKRVVFLVPDTGNKYLSKMYSDDWVRDHGLCPRTTHGDLRDLIARPASEGTAVTAAPTDTLAIALQRLKLYDLSQLPVLAEGRVAGILDESDLLAAVLADPTAFSRPVSDAMTRTVETVPARARTNALFDVFRRDHVAVVVDDDERFLGLVTRIDLLNHLRRKVA